MAGSTTVNTTFEYSYGNRWLLANVAVKEQNGVKTIVGFNVNPESQSLESLNRFTLAGKSPAQYLLLVAAAFAALLTLYALVACIRTKLPGKKWPWILFIIFGFGQVTVNWTTGQYSVVPIAVQLFSASAAAQFYGPWIIAVSAPIGAIAFLIYRKVRLAASTEGQ